MRLMTEKQRAARVLHDLRHRPEMFVMTAEALVVTVETVLEIFTGNQPRICEVVFKGQGCAADAQAMMRTATRVFSHQIFEGFVDPHLRKHGLSDLIEGRTDYRCTRCGRIEKSGPLPSPPALAVYPLPSGWMLVPCPSPEMRDDHVHCPDCAKEVR